MWPYKQERECNRLACLGQPVRLDTCVQARQENKICILMRSEHCSPVVFNKSERLGESACQFLVPLFRAGRVDLHQTFGSGQHAYYLSSTWAGRLQRPAPQGTPPTGLHAPTVISCARANLWKQSSLAWTHHLYYSLSCCLCSQIRPFTTVRPVPTRSQACRSLSKTGKQ